MNENGTNAQSPTSIGETVFNIFVGFLFALVSLFFGASTVVFAVASCLSEPTRGLQLLPLNLFASLVMGAVAFVGISMVGQGLAGARMWR